MDALLEWLATYSAPVVALLVVGAGLALVVRTAVERAVTARLDAYAEDLRLRLGRRSGFEERVLTDRYATFLDLGERLQEVTTWLNRVRQGQAPPEGFRVAGELVPLTRIFMDLGAKRLLLGPRLHASLQRAAGAALTLARARDDAAWRAATQEWSAVLDALDRAADEEFGLSRIRW